MRTARSLTVSRRIPRMPPPEQPRMPPQSNHACPPRATTHAPRATMHAPQEQPHMPSHPEQPCTPPKQPRMPPLEQPRTPPGATMHAPPRATTHTPRSNYACPPWTEWQTGVKILPCPKLRLRAVNNDWIRTSVSMLAWYLVNRGWNPFL